MNMKIDDSPRFFTTSSTYPPSKEFENKCISIIMAALPSELSNNECETKIKLFKFCGNFGGLL
jgi:hypothetical protein